MDILPFTKEVISNVPSESLPYPVWGNKIGCFDNDIKTNEKYDVYLSGDSMTWGYAPLNKKFGTILEKKLGLNVAACGVTHTGTSHQFDKFKEISKNLGYFPKTVIVNYSYNDIDNDFSYPHTTIKKGYQYNNKVIFNENGIPTITKVPDETLDLILEKQLSSKTKARLGKYDPRKYSATSVLLWHSFVKPFTSRQLKKNSPFCSRFDKKIITTTRKEDKSLDVCGVNSNGCKSIYGVSKCFSGLSSEKFPINSDIAENNRNAITNWIKHSRKNNYNLIFADILSQLMYSTSKGDFNLVGKSESQEFCNFIKTQNGNCFSFISYLDSIELYDWRILRWKRDGHFNFKGNQIYADFLENIYLKN